MVRLYPQLSPHPSMDDEASSSSGGASSAPAPPIPKPRTRVREVWESSYPTVEWSDLPSEPCPPELLSGESTVVELASEFEQLSVPLRTAPPRPPPPKPPRHPSQLEIQETEGEKEEEEEGKTRLREIDEMCDSGTCLAPPQLPMTPVSPRRVDRACDSQEEEDESGDEYEKVERRWDRVDYVENPVYMSLYEFRSSLPVVATATATIAASHPSSTTASHPSQQQQRAASQPPAVPARPPPERPERPSMDAMVAAELLPSPVTRPVPPPRSPRPGGAGLPRPATMENSARIEEVASFLFPSPLLPTPSNSFDDLPSGRFSDPFAEAKARETVMGESPLVARPESPPPVPAERKTSNPFVVMQEHHNPPQPLPRRKESRVSLNPFLDPLPVPDRPDVSLELDSTASTLSDPFGAAPFSDLDTSVQSSAGSSMIAHPHPYANVDTLKEMSRRNTQERGIDVVEHDYVLPPQPTYFIPPDSHTMSPPHEHAPTLPGHAPPPPAPPTGMDGKRAAEVLAEVFGGTMRKERRSPVREVESRGAEEREQVEHVDGTSVCFSDEVELVREKKKEKEWKKCQARLRDNQLACYHDEEVDTAFIGPFPLGEAEFLGRVADQPKQIVARFTLRGTAPVVSSGEGTLSRRLRRRDSVAVEPRAVQLSVSDETKADVWMLLLIEGWKSCVPCVGGMRGASSPSSRVLAAGRLWARQGASATWTAAAAVLCDDRTLYYVLLDSPSFTYQLDVRKIVGTRTRLEPTEWCPHTNKCLQGTGPFLLALDGCSLSLECECDAATSDWLTAIETELARPGAGLEQCRLMADDVPVIVEKCIRFVTAHGLQLEGVYRRNGKATEAKQIMAMMQQDPVAAHIVLDTEETVFAVADVLRQFFRRLARPLFPADTHAELYAIQADQLSDQLTRWSEYRRVCMSMPPVQYATIRRLIGHLRQVTLHSTVNRATVENVGKVFGPTVFVVDGDSSGAMRDTGAQIGVIIDLIAGYQAIFDVTTHEEIRDAVVEQASFYNKGKARADGLLVPIHLWEKENRPFNVKTDLVADEVIRQAVTMRGFDAPANENYAIFEVIREGCLQRRLLPAEKLAAVVVGRWITWGCADGYLRLDHDNNPYQEANMSLLSGKVKVAEAGSKSFRGCEMRIEQSTRVVMYKETKQLKQWPVEETVWYVGAEQGRKTPYPFSLTFIHLPTVQFADRYAGVCVSFKTLSDRVKFLNGILFAQCGGEPAPLVHF